MPIYAYRCSNCGHAQDALQKISDPLLTVCPACGESTYVKQVTAAGFQLKGSGWYVTDFRGGDNKAGGKADDSGSGEGKSGESKPADGGADAGAKAGNATADAAKKTPSATPTSAPAAAPSPAAAPAASPPSSGKTGG